MAKKGNSDGQQLLTVVTKFDENPDKDHTDPSTGQGHLFSIVREFAPMVPPGMEQFAQFMNTKLSQTQKEAKELRGDLKRTTEQFQRVGSSLEKVISKFEEKTVGGENPDLVISPHDSVNQADVAFVDSTLPAEAIYTMTPSSIAAAVGNDKMTPSMMGSVLRKLEIFGNKRFHHQAVRGKSVLHSYKPQTIDEIYRRIKNPEQYGLQPHVVARVANYIRPKEAMG